jgi:hypothetical protein
MLCADKLGLTYGNEISAISPKGKKAASRFAAVTMGAKPPTNTVAFQRD